MKVSTVTICMASFSLIMTTLQVVYIQLNGHRNGLEQFNYEDFHIQLKHYGNDRHHIQMNCVENGIHVAEKRIVTEKETFRISLPDSACHYNSTKSIPIKVVGIVPTWTALEDQFTMLGKGGHYKPPASCIARHRLAIIIPYRNREQHLKLFLQHMHPFLQAQVLEYTIYVVELEKDVIFKKGLLMNAGFIEILRRKQFDCYVFHDVDMLPMDLSIRYNCTKNHVYHPTEYIKQYNFKLKYRMYMGGVLMFPENVYRKVNGFSNLYWGWGGEDDDMYYRLKHKRVIVQGVGSNRLRFWTWSHSREEEFVNRNDFVRDATKRMNVEGLNSAKSMYHVLNVEEGPLFTRIYVSANQTDGSFRQLKPIHKPNNKTF